MLFENKSGKQGKVVHTLRFCSKFPIGILANLLVGEYPQSPFEHYLAVVATPPAEAHDTQVSSSLFLCFFFLSGEFIIP